MPTSQSESPPFELNLNARAVFKVVTIYEDSAAGIRAEKMLVRLATKLKPQLELKIELLNFDLLEIPCLSETVATSAAAADMIIISARGASELPAYVKNWIESWLPHKRGDLSVLVALIDREQDHFGQSPILCAYLWRIAEKGSMDFFCKAGDWRQQKFEYTIDNTLHREESRSSVLERILHQDPAWRTWGINE